MLGRLCLALVVMLSGWAGAAYGFSFCFSFGRRDSDRSHYDDYFPYRSRIPPGAYWNYPYSPAPAYPGYGGYYPVLPALQALDPLPAEKGSE